MPQTIWPLWVSLGMVLKGCPKPLCCFVRLWQRFYRDAPSHSAIFVYDLDTKSIKTPPPHVIISTPHFIIPTPPRAGAMFIIPTPLISVACHYYDRIDEDHGDRAYEFLSRITDKIIEDRRRQANVEAHIRDGQPRPPKKTAPARETPPGGGKPGGNDPKGNGKGKGDKC